MTDGHGDFQSNVNNSHLWQLQAEIGSRSVASEHWTTREAMLLDIVRVDETNGNCS